MAKKILKKNIHALFRQVRKSRVWQFVDKLPLYVRLIGALVLIPFGIIAVLTPIPLGVVFLVAGVALLLGLRRTRAYLFSFIYFTRLHILYGKVYIWWKQRRSK